MQHLNLGLPDELLAAVDAARGDVARTVWIRRAIERRLAMDRFAYEPVKDKVASLGKGRAE